VPNFHKDFVGLTGTDAEIKAVASKYKAYYAKVNGDDPGGNYTMDHSSFTYLMGPDGSYINVFNHGVDSEAMALKLKEIIKD
jgi:protein SCO1/2